MPDLTKSDKSSIMLKVEYKGYDEDGTECASQRESGMVESRRTAPGIPITSELRSQKLMQVDFSVQATLVHRACLSLKEVRKIAQFEWYRG